VPPDTTTLAADRLEQALRSGTAAPPVRDLLGDTDVAAAYVVQAELTRRRVAAGGVVVGRKIGLTSPAVQEQLGVDQPDFGVLFADMHVPDGGTLPTSTLVQPKVEAEVAFILGSDLDGELDLHTVRAAVTHAVPALEIVDSRVDDWDITIVDTVADNGSSAAFVLGEVAVPLSEVEPRDVQMTLTVDDEVASSGNGAACLGDPLEALLWLARAAQQVGDPLREGQIILSGALGPMVAATAGTTVRAFITELGDVSVRFDQEVRP